MKVLLEKSNPHDGKTQWKECEPFVENRRGTLVHRIRSGALYNLHRKPHIGVSFWCGMATTDSKGNLSFLAEPSEGKILCERCEMMAVKFGQDPSSAIAGRHVHVGRTVAVITCCEELK